MMFAGWIVIVASILYLAGLFLVANYGDRAARRRERDWPGSGGSHGSQSVGRPTLYALSIAIYCTSWTFFGSVGLAANTGWDFLGIYIGPILVFTFGLPLVKHIVSVSKTQRITSVADFVSARYGKSQLVAIVATLIAVVASVPYIALQLKAVSTSLSAVVLQGRGGETVEANVLSAGPITADIAFVVSVVMAIFAILFGTRHSDATEHQEGLMLAVSTESVVKLVAFMTVGLFACLVIFSSPFDLVESARAAGISELYELPFNWQTLAVFSFLSAIAILLLPRQFHVTVVENNSPRELERASWLFPLYLIAINIFVVPIAIAGQLTFGPNVNADMFVLALPLFAESYSVMLIAFIGGLSAATAMVIVAAVALSIMISNQIVIPLMLRGAAARLADRDMMRTVLIVRRISIFSVIALGYVYFALAGDSAALASIGLLAFAAIAQLAPAFFGGLLWRRANARGAVGGMVTGVALWAYTLLIPSVSGDASIFSSVIAEGPFNIGWLRPEAFFGSEMPTLLHGVFWSLLGNLIAYIGFSLSRQPSPLERLQADSFVKSNLGGTSERFALRRSWRRAVTVGELQDTIGRYLGRERADRAIRSYAHEHRIDRNPLVIADQQLVSHAEQLLASAIGAASSRLVFSLLMQRNDPAAKATAELLDDASRALQYNRDLLQSAIDHVYQGIAVFDRNLRLICWNRHFRSMLGLPPEFGQVGTSLGDVIRYGVEAGTYGQGNPSAMIDERLRKLVEAPTIFEETVATLGMVLEVRTNKMPDGGIVITYTDVSERVASKNALEEINQDLELRVKYRTEELTQLNAQLEQASQIANDANLSKTRFLAAAGHDILQPLNAARLYTSALVDQLDGKAENNAQHVEAALSSVEEIMSALLDISKLDAGAMTPNNTVFGLDELLEQLRLEFQPVAQAKSLKFSVVKSGLFVRSDRSLLRRLLQNLISNAIKYTESGTVLVGCKRGNGRAKLQVWDTGQGIPDTMQKTIFEEFRRLDAGKRLAPGLGLGLSIVERLSKVLDHPIELDSQPDRGTRFSVSLPIEQPVAQPVASPRKIASSNSVTQLTGLSIMCVDNEAEILTGMQALLEGWGCHVLIASTHIDAEIRMSKFREETGRMPDVLLMDYHLDEGVLGVDVIGKLREKFNYSITAILITADRSPDVRNQAAAIGAITLNKPVKPAALRSLLQQSRMSA